MLSVVALQPTAQAATTSALHTQGAYILDTNGNSVYLRGMGLAGFAPDMILWGSGSSDNLGNQWNYNPTTVMDQTFSSHEERLAHQHDTGVCFPKLVVQRQHCPSTGKLKLQQLNNPNQHQNLHENPLPRS